MKTLPDLMLKVLKDFHNQHKNWVLTARKYWSWLKKAPKKSICIYCAAPTTTQVPVNV